MKIVQPITITDSGTFSRASTATYFNSSLVLSTAAVDERRITFSPDGTSRELIEAVATNILTFSEGTVAQLGTSANVIDAAVTVPGYSNSIYFASAPSTTYFAYKTATITAGLPFTLSVTVLMDNAGEPSVGASATTGNFGIVFEQNLVTNLATLVKTHLGGGRYRISVTFVGLGSGASNFGIVKYDTQSSVGFKVTGYQLEAGSSATSYIPTTTVAVTRAADIPASMLQSNVPETDYTAYSASTGYTIGANVRSVGTNTHKTYQALKGGVFVVTMTIASPCVVTFPTGSNITEGLPIVFTTTGALPTGIVAGTTYYVKGLTGNTFNVAATLGGAAINTSGTQSGVHSVNTNYNVPVTDTAYWLDTGATNRWKMFDGSVQSQTTNPTSIHTVITTSSFIDTIAFLNVAASSIRVVMTTTDGVVYDQTRTLSSNLGITDWYSYFYTPIFRQTDVIFEGLPLYGTATITATITNSGTAACGAFVLGKATDISYTKKGVEHGARLGIQDYSLKTRDAFGNYMITERAFNRRADYTVYIEGNQVDGIINLLASIRAKPILYIGSGKYSSTAVYGFYKDFTVEIAYPTVSVCTIQLEGLT